MFASTSLALVLLTTPVLAGGGNDQAVAEAIVKAVRLRLGPSANVVVSSLQGVRLLPGAADGAATPTTIIATPEPAATLGRPVRFLLANAQPGRQATRIGEAVATLDVTAPFVVTTRAVARGERLTADVLDVRTERVDRAALRPLLSLEEARDGRATRDLSEGVRLSRADVAAEAVVRAGDVVRAHAQIDGVEIVGDMVAAEPGNVGDVIRVVNHETKYAARARVAGRGEVEVVNVR